MVCTPEHYLTHLVVLFSPTEMSFRNQQVQILITTLYSIVAVNSDGIANNIHHNYSSILRQWHSCLILQVINKILYFFLSSIYKLTMVDLLISQLNSISNGMIMNNSVINNNILSSNNVLFVLFQMLLIIFVFSYYNNFKNDGTIIVGLNIDTQLYIFKLKRHINNMKSIIIRLIFCLISTFGDSVDINLYLSKEYANDNNYSVCLIDDGCLQRDYITNNNIIYLLIIIILVYLRKINYNILKWSHITYI